MSSLAAARADNFYIPKDFDPKKHKSLNDYNRKKKAEKFKKRHPDGKNIGGKRAKSEWVNKVRFECPFHVKCLSCGTMMAKGKRFNALKKPIGKYFSTTIWQFQIVCKGCPQKIIVETDPKNTEFEFRSGAKRIYRTENATDTSRIVDLKKNKEVKDNVFIHLEHKLADEERAKLQKPRLQSILDLNESRWEDDYAANSLLRKRFRNETKRLKSSENFKHGMQLKDLSEADLRSIKRKQFSTSDRRKKGSKSRDMLMAKSIFGSKRTDPELMRLKKKLSNLPQSTLNVLRTG